VSTGFSHLIADFVGVPPAQLRDGTLLSGLLIAAASAAGLSIVGTPVVRRLPTGGVAALLLLEGCHIAVHTVPAGELLLLDVLALTTHDVGKALDVFARRVGAREIRSEVRARG
jgi:S-adenosylmethionine/arginine decarboxylase-like enzyme